MPAIFNKEQEEAITHKEGPLMVLAGPGSGKTLVITYRVKWLIENAGVHPSNILVITFTRAAAEEMRKRFFAFDGMENAPVTFGTFHSIFFMILRYAYRYTAGNIIREDVKRRYIKEMTENMELEIEDEKEFLSGIINEISYVKGEMMSLSYYHSSNCSNELFAQIYEGYERRLREENLIDFDDMLVFCYELLKERKDILAMWQQKFQYILIDEFQDINKVQYEIVRMLAGKGDHLFIVGDDDQSIYRFRGSKPEIMLQFTKVYPKAKVVTLDVNYRCTPAVVEASRRLISHNEERFKKTITAHRREQDPVKFFLFEDERQENTFLIDEIEKARAEGIPLSQIAVLFRTNVQPRLLMEQMLSRNMAFRTKDRIPNVYEHWIAKDFFAYIRIAQGSDKRADFLSIMNKPKRYIGRDSLCEPHVAFDEWIRMYDEQPWIAERIEQLWHDTRVLNTLSPYAAINFIRRGIGYDDYIADYADYRNVNKDDLYDVADEILSNAKGYRTLEEWYTHIENYKKELEELAKRGNSNEDAVVLATLHSSKGLEFEKVFLIDVNEGITPYKKAVLQPDMEEERRLFYVGMTRAKRSLTLCSVKTLHNKKVELSRFLKEAGAESLPKE